MMFNAIYRLRLDKQMRKLYKITHIDIESRSKTILGHFQSICTH